MHPTVDDIRRTAGATSPRNRHTVGSACGDHSAREDGGELYRVSRRSSLESVYLPCPKFSASDVLSIGADEIRATKDSKKRVTAYASYRLDLVTPAG